jgi:hypothetical protein
VHSTVQQSWPNGVISTALTRRALICGVRAFTTSAARLLPRHWPWRASIHGAAVFISRAMHGGVVKDVSFLKKISNNIRFKNSFQKILKIKKYS